MRYCRAEYKATQENEAYRVYLTECVRQAQNNLATIQSSLGSPAGLISQKYYDIKHKEQPEETRTPEEIKAKFIGAFG